jgi:hypothetical protein
VHKFIASAQRAIHVDVISLEIQREIAHSDLAKTTMETLRTMGDMMTIMFVMQ